MKTQTYNYDKIGENCAKASGVSLSISSKHSIEVCRLIRNQKLAKAKGLLEQAIALKKPIPFKRFTGDVGHRKGNLTSGRFPVKACGSILGILNSAEKNALTKGLSVNDLVIVLAIANRGQGDLRYGRLRGRKAKRTHIKIIVEEKKEEKKKETKKETVKKVKEVKKEVKPEIKKQVPKKEPTQVQKKPLNEAKND